MTSTIAVQPRTPPRLRRIPLSVRNAVLGRLNALNCDVLTDAEFADDLARAAIDAWEGLPPEPDPELVITKHPGGGWYWQCWIADEDCADGSWTNWYGWPHEVDARDEGRIHIAKTHRKETT